jgi:sigma-54 dependent transcriptional regulator, acetoin dehydrogenase operon transcriptional activator AcoR
LPVETFETQTDAGSQVSWSATGEHWVLTLAYQPQSPEVIGERLVLLEDDRAVLGRQCEQFSAAAFDDPRASRKHVEIRCKAGVLFAEDLGSRNGTLVNGRPISRAELALGDVLTVGGVLLLVQRGPRFIPRHRHAEIVGVGPSCARVLHRIALAAPTDTGVLIRGETGVGKELVARAVHAQSGRAGRFVAVNCSALPDGVVQSELFGHAKGAFSGATAARDGLVAAAANGTLFLDEIGDASPLLQSTLLRLLEQREYREVGSNTTQIATARVVMATNVALEQAVDEGRFRADLLGRITRWTIDVPPLREHLEDVIPLALHFAARRAGLAVKLSRSFAHALLRHDWPANVRELQSVVEQTLLAKGAAEPLTLDDDLATRLAAPPARPSVAPPSPVRRGVRRVRPSPVELEERFKALGQNASALAAELGVGRTTVYRWIREAGLEMGDLREEGRDEEE